MFVSPFALNCVFIKLVVTSDCMESSLGVIQKRAKKVHIEFTPTKIYLENKGRYNEGNRQLIGLIQFVKVLNSVNIFLDFFTLCLNSLSRQVV